MPTPFESAQLNLQLFDLRREPVLREARAWFLREFRPETFEAFAEIIRGERNASFRMVMGYWDMACSLVTTGAIDADAFRAAHGEMFAVFALVQPFLAQLRASRGEEVFKHFEAVVMSAPGIDALLQRRREILRALARPAAAADKK